MKSTQRGIDEDTPQFKVQVYSKMSVQEQQELVTMVERTLKAGRPINIAIMWPSWEEQRELGMLEGQLWNTGETAEE